MPIPGMVPPPPLQVLEDMAAYSDFLDVLSARHVQVARFARNHDLLASVLDPWTERQVLEGQLREFESKAEGMRMKALGVAPAVAKGLEGGLSELAGARRVGRQGQATPAVAKPEAEEAEGTAAVQDKKTLTLDERRQKLLEMRDRELAACEALEKRWAATKGDLGRVVTA